MPVSLAPSLAELTVPAGLLDASETGILHLQPVYASDDPTRLVDFTFLRLNPAAQRLLGLPEFPTGSFRTLRPGDAAAFQFFHFTYLAGEVDVLLPGSLPGWRALAQRQGAQLVVSLAPAGGAGEQPGHNTVRRAAADGALARAQQANQQLTQERDLLRRVLAQAPAAIGLLRGPEYRFDYLNPALAQLFAGRELAGLPAADVLPAALNEGLLALLDLVYDTGETLLQVEVPLASPQPGAADQLQYFNFTYQAHLADGHPSHLSLFACNATEQVLARQQLRQLQEELATARAQLAEAQAACTTTPSPAVSQAPGQPDLLRQILGQLPAAVAALAGPEHRFAYFNDGYQVLAGGRARLGQTIADSLPELAARGFTALLDNVYATGQPHWGDQQPDHFYALLRSQLTLGPQYLNFLYQPLKDTRGQTQGILAFIVDVTAQVLA